MAFQISDFTPQDSEELAKLAVAALEQYKEVYDDWDVFISRIHKRGQATFFKL